MILMKERKVSFSKTVLVLLLTVSMLMTATGTLGQATYAASAEDLLNRPLDCYFESEGGRINIERVNNMNYLFLPNEADTEHITIKSEKDDRKVWFNVDGTETETVSLDALPKKGSYSAVEVVIRDLSGNKKSDFDLRIQKGTGIGTVYYISDDPENKGRAWVERVKGYESSGKALVFDENGKNLTKDAKNQVVEDFHGRGNSSWGDPKKGYQIKFDKKISLIDGTGKEKKWILLAQYKDPLRMSDVLCKKIASMTRSDFSPKATWVNFYYDGEYRGVYELTEKNEIKSSRIDINDLEDEYEDQDPDYGDHTELLTDTNAYGNTYRYQDGLVGPEEPGGFLIEMNDLAYDENNGFMFNVGSAVRAANLKSPDLGSKEFIKYVSEYFQEFCNATTAVDENGVSTGKNPDTGKYFYEYCDFDSLVDTYLVQSLASNNDTFWKSQYFYKDRGGLMVSGPIWDMDLSFGTGWSSEMNPETDYLAGTLIAGNLMRNKEFRRKVSQRYLEAYSPILESLIDTGELLPTFKQTYRDLRSNLTMDTVLWPAKYKCGSGYLQWGSGTSFATIVDYRVDWLKKHKAYLDSYFKKMAADEEEEHIFVDPVPATTTTHKMTCVNHPDVEMEEDCTFDTVYNGDGTHTVACTKCTNSTVEPCDVTYRDNGDGTHTATCKACGNEETTEHTWDSGKIDRKATTSKAGSRTYTCTGCGATKQETIPKVKESQITINTAIVTASSVKKIKTKVEAAGGTTTMIVLGKKVKTIKKGVFKKTGIKTIKVKTKLLKAGKVKGSLKGSTVTAVKVKVGSSKVNKKFVKKYKKIFTKKNAGKKVKVS